MGLKKETQNRETNSYWINADKSIRLNWNCFEQLRMKLVKDLNEFKEVIKEEIVIYSKK